MVDYSSLFVRVLGFFLLITLGLTLGHILSNVLYKILHDMEVDKILKKQLHLRFSLEKHLSSFLKYLVYGFALIVGLTQLGVPARVLWIFFFAVLVLIVLFLLFAFKDWIPSVLSGVYILHTQKIKRGETIRTEGFTGKVVKVNLLETKFQVKNKEMIFVPNSLLMKQEIEVMKGKI